MVKADIKTQTLNHSVTPRVYFKTSLPPPPQNPDWKQLQEWHIINVYLPPPQCILGQASCEGE